MTWFIHLFEVLHQTETKSMLSSAVNSLELLTENIMSETTTIVPYEINVLKTIQIVKPHLVFPHYSFNDN